MFKLVPDHTYKHKVAIKKPVDGGYENVETEVTFRALSESRIREVLLTTPSDENLLKAVLVNMPVADEQGRELPWSEELRDRLIDIPYVRVRLVDAYLTSVHGAPSKN